MAGARCGTIMSFGLPLPKHAVVCSTKAVSVIPCLWTIDSLNLQKWAEFGFRYTRHMVHRNTAPAIKRIARLN